MSLLRNSTFNLENETMTLVKLDLAKMFAQEWDFWLVVGEFDAWWAGAAF